MSTNKPKALTPQQRQLKSVRDAVRKSKKQANLIKAPRSESDYYEEYYDEEGESANSIDKEEEQYLEFLEEWGHIDFTMLLLLPQIRTVEELQEIRE
jgi:phage-related tail protein